MAKTTPDRISLAHAPNLRACISQSAECEKLFLEVEALWNDLFEPSKMRSRFRWFDKFENFLKEDHCLAVEATLDKVIFGCLSESDGTLPVGSFVPRPEEALILLSAVRLRCIGLLWGIFSEERLPHSQDLEHSQATIPRWIVTKTDGSSQLDRKLVQELIATFASRSARYIRVFWRLNCTWSDIRRAILASVIEGYFPGDHELSVQERIEGFNIRKMAFLLRIAATCSFTKDICPLELRLRLKPDEFCDPRKTHLAAVKWISKIEFDHGRHVIEFFPFLPDPQRIPPPDKNGSTAVLPVVTLDYQPAVEFFGHAIQEVLDTVKGYLGCCPNTDFQTIKMTCSRLPFGFAEPQSYLPDHWALAFASSCNAVEVAGMMALIMRSFCDYGFNDNSPISAQVREVCSAASKLHPFNALTYRLTHDVRKWTAWNGEPNPHELSEFRKHLDDYLQRREDAGNTVADQALQAGVLSGVDVAIIYGYGRCVLSTLCRSGFKGTVLIVTTDESYRGPWIRHEGERIVEILDRHKLACEETSLGELSARLARFKFDDTRKRIVFLCGSRCVLAPPNHPREFLSPIGNRSIALTVRDFDGRVILLAEGDKVIESSDACEEIKRRLKISDPRPWQQIDILKEKQQIDQVVIAGGSPFSDDTVSP